jgi:hypothetical protein
MMTRKVAWKILTFVAWLTTTMVPAWPQSKLQKIKTDYQSVSSQLQKHLVFDWWIDHEQESPELLARQWSLAGEWVATWLDANPSAGPGAVEAAISELVPTEEPGEYLNLTEDVFLVTAPGPIGNVFIVAKLNGHYRVAWSTEQTQEASGEQGEILAAWRAENAQHGGRGPYWAASGSAGSVIPRLGKLPNDAKGHARFYIDGMYAQGAGGTVGKQISLWLWDGVTARPLVARAYTSMIDQAVGTRVEGDLLKVQQKKFFRTFFSCGMCEERQTDWIVRLTPEGVDDLGEQSMVPELDAVDELLYRVIHHKPATDVASPAAIEAAGWMVRAARAEHTEKEWKKFPTLGMIMGWKIQDNRDKKTLCLNLDYSGLFTLKSVGGKLIITDLRETEQSCEK